MDLARHTGDGTTYNAQTFAALPPHELEARRRALVCHECGGPAFFRRASRSGQAACFGARPHEPGCASATPEPRVILGELEVVEARVNPGDRIVVDLRFGAAAAANVVAGGGRDGAGRARGNHFVTGDGGGQGAVSRRRLTPLLRMLVNDPTFQSSTHSIEVPGHAPMLVRDLFVPFPGIDAGRHFNAFHGYWGFLADAKAGPDGALWLNSGGSWREFSIVVPAELVAAFRERFSVADLEDLAGAYALVFAPLQVSGKEKPFIALADLDSIAVYQP